MIKKWNVLSIKTNNFKDILGLKLKAPLSFNPVVYSLPMMSIKEDKGTGIEYKIQDPIQL